MKNIKGEKTKSDIIRVITRMFYENGFEATSFAEISNALGISQGNLHYHFHSKDVMCRQVIGQHYRENLQNAMRISNSELNAYEIQVLMYNIFWYQFFTDNKYARFASEIAYTLSSEEAREYFSSYCEAAGISINPEDKLQLLNLYSCASVEASLPKYLYGHTEAYTYEEVADYDIRLMAGYLGPDRETVEKAIAKIRNLLNHTDLACFEVAKSFLPEGGQS